MTPDDPRTYWFDDFAAGQVFDLGAVTMDEAEMLEFAGRYDPQAFHLDHEKAAESAFGGLIASGWLTASLMMRLLTEGFVGEASLGAAGIDELRWSAPVRPADRLRLRVTVEATRPSKTYDNRGFVYTFNETLDADDRVVMSMKPTMMIKRRST